MRIVLASLACAVAALAGWPGGANAKLPTYIITGGEMGPYATAFTLDGYTAFNVVGVKAAVEPPDEVPEVSYEIYGGGVLYDFARGERGPRYRYYPDGDLLKDLGEGSWYRLAPERAAEIDAVIDHAVLHRGAGDLERGVMRAALRAWGYTDARMWVDAENSVANRGPAAHCPCDIPSAWMERWIMIHFVETVEGTSRETPADDSADLQVMVARRGQDGYGWFGKYAFPEGGAPGRLWIVFRPGGLAEYYYETTPGFDAVIAEALATQSDESSEDAARSDAPADVPWRALGGGLAAVGVAAAGLFAWRRRA